MRDAAPPILNRIYRKLRSLSLYPRYREYVAGTRNREEAGQVAGVFHAPEHRNLVEHLAGARVVPLDEADDIDVADGAQHVSDFAGKAPRAENENLSTGLHYATDPSASFASDSRSTLHTVSTSLRVKSG